MPSTAGPRPIWNPSAACNWSLVFSPAFGAFLHALNWSSLNEPARARASMAWFYVALVMAGAAPMLMLVGAPPPAVQSVALALLFVWRFSAAGRQIKYVKEKFGKSYPRRPWGRPLLIAFASYTAYIVLMFVLAMMAFITLGLLGRR